jgi:hypothetical protein
MDAFEPRLGSEDRDRVLPDCPRLGLKNDKMMSMYKERFSADYKDLVTPNPKGITAQELPISASPITG